MNQPAVIAVDVGGTTIKAARFDEGDRATDERVVPVTLGAADDTIAKLIAVVDELVARARTDGQPATAIGLAVPGIVDANIGVGRLSMLLGWRDVPFVSLLSSRTGLPVGLQHDVVAGALAENASGAATGCTDWLFLALGTGLGAAFFFAGRPYRGAHGYGGELAHVVVHPGGLKCRCGKRGCAEMYCSASALVSRYAQQSGRPLPTAAAVIEAAATGDATAAVVWEEAIDALAAVVAGHIESTDPELVVIGGGLADSGPALFGPFTERLARRVAFAPLPPVRRAVHGARAGMLGAALTARSARTHSYPSPGPGTFPG